MDTRVAVISIIVEQEDAIEELNTLLHEARQYIVCLLYTSRCV